MVNVPLRQILDAVPRDKQKTLSQGRPFFQWAPYQCLCREPIYTARCSHDNVPGHLSCMLFVTLRAMSHWVSFTDGAYRLPNNEQLHCFGYCISCNEWPYGQGLVHSLTLVVPRSPQLRWACGASSVASMRFCSAFSSIWLSSQPMVYSYS